MKNPFPGMNPYLEGHVWPGLHHNLISQIQRMLQPQLRPKYLARAEKYVVKDNNPLSELGIIYPDVGIVEQKINEVKEPVLVYQGANDPTPPTLDFPIYPPVKVNIPFLKITDTAQRQLITVIEILSPVNKRKPGFTPYLKKRAELIGAGVHFLEIDLLRRGLRTIEHPQLNQTDYLCALTRADTQRREVWAINLRSRLPILPIPLQTGDKDALLDLQKALNEVYEALDYEYDVDYQKEPPPPNLTKKNQQWLKTVIDKPDE